MARQWFPIVSRVSLALGLLIASFLVMAMMLAPEDAGAPGSLQNSYYHETGRAAMAPLERVAGVLVTGDGANSAPAQAEFEPGPPSTIVIPGLTAGGIVSTPPAEFLALEQTLQALVAPHEGATRYALAVTDLQTGYTIGVNHTRQQLSGCVMNYFVILRAVLDVQEGRYPLSTVDSLIRATTWSSNATTARELYRIVGGGDAVEGVRRVAALHQDLGLEGMVIDHPPAYGGDSLGIDFNNWLTAASVNSAMAELWHGEMLSVENRAYMLEVLADVKPGLNYLVAYVPGQAVVSHKNGFFPSDIGYIDNDAGIVQVSGPNGDYAYVVTFLAEGAPWKYADLPLGQELMRVTWEYFAAQYGG